MSWYGRLCLEHIARLQPDADFWGPWVDRLHPDEQRALKAGEIGIIKRPFQPDWMVGEWMELGSNIWLRPHQARFTHRGWRITFDLRDFRVRIPRRTPGMFEPPDVDDAGYPIEHDAEAIAAATEDGNYTSAAELAVPETDEGVPRDYDNVLVMASRERRAGRLEEARGEKSEREAREDTKRVAARLKALMVQEARAGRDPTVLLARIEHELRAYEHQVKQAA